jgi:hypothetical protein
MSETIEREDGLEEEALGRESPSGARETRPLQAEAIEAATPVTADVAHIEESGAQVVEAETIHVQSGGIGKATAGTIDVQEGGIGIAQGETITVHEGGIGIALAERAEVHAGGVLFLLAEEISGETKVLFDLKAAVLFGLIVGVVSGLFKLFAGRKGH